MKLLYIKILSFLFLISSAHAFQYEPKNLSFTERSYNLYIKPQLKSLIQDYQTLYKAISIDEKIASRHHRLLLRWQKKSNQLNARCLNNFSNSACDKLQKAFWTLIKDTLVHTEVLARTLPFSNLDKIKRIHFLNLETYKMEDMIIKLKLNKNNEDIQKNYVLLAKEISIYQELLAEMELLLLPSIYREHFSLVKMNFFTPIINNFISNNKYKNLYTMTKDLNKSFNVFLMDMLKKGKPISSKAKALLEVMQRRWNSVLKVVVKR